MEEITDDLIKAKHKEFNDRIRKTLKEVQDSDKGGVVSRLRQAIANMRISKRG